MESSDSKGISRRAVLIGGGVGVAAAAAGATAVLTRDGGPSGFAAALIDDELPFEDPASSLWGKASTSTFPLNAQKMVNPHLQEQTLTEVEVKVLFNGNDLAVRLEWADSKVDEQEGIAIFRDAAAVMLPASLNLATPVITMGALNSQVYIAQWRASWQADVDRGFQDVAQKYPNWYSDVGPFHETLVELGLDAEQASVYAPGRHVGNPLSQRERTSPVQELSAEGFGTLTHDEEQNGVGRGVNADGRWQVCIGVKGGKNAPDLSSAATVPMAFAIWQGEHQQVGARKHYADWVDLTLRAGA